MAESSSKKSRSKKRRASKNSNRLGWILGIAAVAALIIVPIVINVARRANLPGERFPSQGNAHVEVGAEVAPYSNPPTSGPHSGQLAAWTAYDFIVPEQRLIHNMEDGGVVLWYLFGTEEENRAHIDALQEVARPYRRVVIAPRESMPTTYALTAWQRLQRFDEIDVDAMRKFIDAYEGIDHHGGF